MKGNMFARALGAVLALLFASSFSYADTAAFEFHIYSRTPPTARVKITLQTSGPVAGSTITVNNQTIGGAPAVINVPGVGNLDNGDRVVAAPQTGNANNVGILYQPWSQLVTNDWCDYKPLANAGDQTVSMVFSGPTVTGHRITSYSTAGSPGIPALDCSQAPRRVNTNQSVFTVPPPGTDLGREPLDIVLVLDESGSMADPPPDDPNPIETKWHVLQTSVGAFIGLWEQTDPGTTDDRLGLIFYSTQVYPASFSGSIFLPRGNAPVGPGHNWQQIIDLVNGKAPLDMTTIGSGLKTAIDDWTSDPRSDASIVLMTDGIQNTPACVIPDGPPWGQPDCWDVDGGVHWKVDGMASPLFRLGIPIMTIGMGTASGVNFDVLQGIATETAGVNYQTSNSETAGSTFGNTLVNIMKGNTLSVISQTAATLSSSSSAGPVKSFLLDGSVRRSIFVLTWQGAQNANVLDLRITPPGGCVHTARGTVCSAIQPVSRTDNPFWTAQAIDIPASGPIGQWSIQVVRKAPIIASLVGVQTPTPTDTPYQLSIYSVDGRLKYRLNFPPNAVGTGDLIKLEMEVSYDGKPLTGLGDSLKVEVERPTSALGTILHDTQVPDTVLNNESSPKDPTNPYNRKLLYLSKTKKLGDIIPRPIPTKYVLRDDGSSSDGDVKANDGIYSAKFADTTRPGLYRFVITMDWNNPVTGQIHRVETIEREIKVNADADRSVVKADKGGTAGEWLITVDPIDRYGNNLGPGYKRGFDVHVSPGGGTVQGFPSDINQTGQYSIRLVGVPAGTDPVVTIKVDGRGIRNDRLSHLAGIGGPGSAISKWAVFVDLGAAIPNGTFGNTFGNGFSLNAGLEYLAKPRVSLEGIFGYHHFGAKTAGTLNLYQFSADAKVYLVPSGPNRPYLEGGIGAYKFSPGPTKFGGNAGAGLLRELTPHWGVQGSYHFHAINTSGAVTKFSTAQGGIRYVF